MGMRGDLAQKMVYCLRNGNVIDVIGKRRRAHLYRVAGPGTAGAFCT
jgi:ribosomal protein S25